MGISIGSVASGSVSSDTNVNIQKKQLDNHEAVVGKILEGVEESSDVLSREAHKTGHDLNIKA